MNSTLENIYGIHSKPVKAVNKPVNMWAIIAGFAIGIPSIIGVGYAVRGVDSADVKTCEETNTCSLAVIYTFGEEVNDMFIRINTHINVAMANIPF